MSLVRITGVRTMLPCHQSVWLAWKIRAFSLPHPAFRIPCSERYSCYRLSCSDWRAFYFTRSLTRQLNLLPGSARCFSPLLLSIKSQSCVWWHRKHLHHLRSWLDWYGGIHQLTRVRSSTAPTIGGKFAPGSAGRVEEYDGQVFWGVEQCFEVEHGRKRPGRGLDWQCQHMPYSTVETTVHIELLCVLHSRVLDNILFN